MPSRSPLARDGDGCLRHLVGLAPHRHRHRSGGARGPVLADREMAAAPTAAAGLPSARCRDRPRQLPGERGGGGAGSGGRVADRGSGPASGRPVPPRRCARRPAGIGAMVRRVRRVRGRRLLGSSPESRDPDVVALPPSPPLGATAGLAGAEPTSPRRRDHRPLVDGSAGPGTRLRRSDRGDALRVETAARTVRPLEHKASLRSVRARRGHAVLPPLAPQRRRRHLEHELRELVAGRRLDLRDDATAQAVAAGVRMRRRRSRRRLRRTIHVGVDATEAASARGGLLAEAVRRRVGRRGLLSRRRIGITANVSTNPTALRPLADVVERSKQVGAGPVPFGDGHARDARASPASW